MATGPVTPAIEAQLKQSTDSIMKSTDSKSTGNRPMFFENRPMIILFMTITPFASMNAKSIPGATHA